MGTRDKLLGTRDGKPVTCDGVLGARDRNPVTCDQNLVTCDQYGKELQKGKKRSRQIEKKYRLLLMLQPNSSIGLIDFEQGLQANGTLYIR